MTSIIVDSSVVAFEPYRVNLGDVYFLGHDGPNPKYCICIITDGSCAYLKATMCKVSIGGHIELEQLDDVTFYKSASSPESFACIHNRVSSDRRYFREAIWADSLTEPFAWKCCANPCQCQNCPVIISPHGQPKPCGRTMCNWVDDSKRVRDYILATHHIGVRL